MEGGTTMASIVTALTTAMGDVATQALSAISGILPIAAPVLGGMLIIGVGIKVFKKITNRN